MRIDYYKTWLGKNNPANFPLMQNNFSSPLLIKTSEDLDPYPNRRDIGETVNETLLFHKTHRPPNYLILDDGMTGWGFSALFDCLCIKFCFKHEKKPKVVKLRNSLEETVINISNNLESVDVLVLPYDNNYNFKDIMTDIKKTAPDLPILIMCYSRDKQIDTQRAERLRKNGHFAFTGKEALDCQEYISELIEKALGEKGVEKLRKPIEDTNLRLVLRESSENGETSNLFLALPKRRILLVDDDRSVKLAIKSFLEKHRADEFEVVEASSSEETLKILGVDKNFDLIISDKDMTRKNDGLVLAKNRPQSIPFILISASIEDIKSTKDLSSLQINIAMKKPVSKDGILTAIDTLLRISETPASIAARAKTDTFTPQ